MGMFVFLIVFDIVMEEGWMGFGFDGFGIVVYILLW